jgi:hypothetical protein
MNHVEFAKRGFAVGVGLIIIGGVATAFHLWFAFLLPLGTAVIPATLLIATMMVPTASVAHCFMCKTGQHESCLSRRTGGIRDRPDPQGMFCCCTTEIVREHPEFDPSEAGKP